MKRMAKKETVPFRGTKEQEAALMAAIEELKDQPGSLMPIMPGRFFRLNPRHHKAKQRPGGNLRGSPPGPVCPDALYETFGDSYYL